MRRASRGFTTIFWTCTAAGACGNVSCLWSTRHCCWPEYSRPVVISTARVMRRKFADLATRCIDASIGNGRRTASARFLKGGSRNAAFCITAGRATTKQPLSMSSGSVRRRIPFRRASFADWTFTYQWENLLGTDVLYSGPLFTHLFSHAWIDYRGIQDGFMREKCSDYFAEHQERNRRASRIRCPQSSRLCRIRSEFVGHYGGRRPGRSGNAAKHSGPAFLWLHVARGAVWAGRRHHRSVGNAGYRAIRCRSGAAGNAAPSQELSAGLHQRPVLERL